MIQGYKEKKKIIFFFIFINELFIKLKYYGKNLT